MITQDWFTKGFSISEQPDLAALAKIALDDANWEPYRDIERLVETSSVYSILGTVSQEIALRFGHNAKVSRREIWR